MCPHTAIHACVLLLLYVSSYCVLREKKGKKEQKKHTQTHHVVAFPVYNFEKSGCSRQIGGGLMKCAYHFSQELWLQQPVIVVFSYFFV
jgi:hypothetical protein